MQPRYALHRQCIGVHRLYDIRSLAQLCQQNIITDTPPIIYEEGRDISVNFSHKLTTGLAFYADLFMSYRKTSDLIWDKNNY